MLMTMPQFAEVPVPPGSPKRLFASRPHGVVIHAMGEFVRGRPAWDFLASLKTPLRAHAYVTPSGVVVTQTPLHRRAAHARGFNATTLGVEVLVRGRYDSVAELEAALSKPWLTSAQLFAAARYVRDLVQTFRFGEDDVLRHDELDASKPDPGPMFPWDTFKREVLS